MHRTWRERTQFPSHAFCANEPISDPIARVIPRGIWRTRPGTPGRADERLFPPERTQFRLRVNPRERTQFRAGWPGPSVIEEGVFSRERTQSVVMEWRERTQFRPRATILTKDRASTRRGGDRPIRRERTQFGRREGHRCRRAEWSDGRYPRPTNRIGRGPWVVATVGSRRMSQARMPFTGVWSSTPVRRWSSPMNLNVSRRWSIPMQWRIVAFMSWMWTGSLTML